MAERPYVWLTSLGRRTRWYPHEYLEAVTLRADIGRIPSYLDPESLDPDECRAALPTLKAAQEALGQLVALVEARAQGKEPALCAVCGSRFYPSRSDARYCSGKCRMRAHRNAPADTLRTGPGAPTV